MPWVMPSVWSVQTSSMTFEHWSASSTKPCRASAWKVSTIQRLPRLCLRIHVGSQATRVGAGVGAGVVQDGVPEGPVLLRIAAPGPKVVVVTAAAIAVAMAVALQAGVPPEEVLSGPVGSARPNRRRALLS